MQAVKTAISIEKNLFEQADKAARAMKVSRSRLFVMALQDFLEHQKNRDLLTQINAACEDESESPEPVLKSALRQQRHLVEGEW